MTRPEKEQFKKPFWERADGKPVSAEDAIKMKTKMQLEMRVKKVVEEAEIPKAPVGKTEAQKEKERIEYIRSLSPRHLSAED